MGKGPKVGEDIINKVRQRIRQAISADEELQKEFDDGMSQGPAPQDEAARRQKMKLVVRDLLERNPSLKQEADRIFKEETAKR
jgi:hypothetical protein